MPALSSASRAGARSALMRMRKQCTQQRRNEEKSFHEMKGGRDGKSVYKKKCNKILPIVQL